MSRTFCWYRLIPISLCSHLTIVTAKIWINYFFKMLKIIVLSLVFQIFVVKSSNNSCLKSYKKNCVSDNQSRTMICAFLNSLTFSKKTTNFVCPIQNVFQKLSVALVFVVTRVKIKIDLIQRVWRVFTSVKYIVFISNIPWS